MANGINQFAEGICPEDCSDDSVLLPELDEDQNCQDGETVAQLSQVCDLYIIPDEVTAVPTDFTTPNMLTYLTDEVDNTNTDNTKIKWLVGEGGVAVPEITTQELPKLGQKTTRRTYTLTFRVSNLSDTQYRFMQRLQCGFTGFTFLYATLGGKLFGNDNNNVQNLPVGINPSSIDVQMPLGNGREDTKFADIIITFDSSDTDPDRIEDPFA